MRSRSLKNWRQLVLQALGKELLMKLVRIWLFVVLGGATGGFHDGQQEPRSM